VTIRIRSLLKKLVVVSGVGAALTAWRNVMLSINARTEDGPAAGSSEEDAPLARTKPPG
jgi:hypothetical protein